MAAFAPVRHCSGAPRRTVARRYAFGVGAFSLGQESRKDAMAKKNELLPDLRRPPSFCKAGHPRRMQSMQEARGVSEHYPKHFDEANEFCSVCQRVTKHRVSGGRLAHCLEHEAPLYSKAQLAARERREREQVTPSLFAWPPGDAA